MCVCVCVCVLVCVRERVACVSYCTCVGSCMFNMWFSGMSVGMQRESINSTRSASHLAVTHLSLSNA